MQQSGRVQEQSSAEVRLVAEHCCLSSRICCAFTSV
jgi:hypothetical protein